MGKGSKNSDKKNQQCGRCCFIAVGIGAANAGKMGKGGENNGKKNQ